MKIVFSSWLMCMSVVGLYMYTMQYSFIMIQCVHRQYKYVHTLSNSSCVCVYASMHVCKNSVYMLCCFTSFPYWDKEIIPT